MRDRLDPMSAGRRALFLLMSLGVIGCGAALASTATLGTCTGQSDLGR